MNGPVAVANGTEEVVSNLSQALALVDRAITLLDRLSLASDSPPAGVVDAADGLDAARVGLVQAVKGGPHHDAT